MQDNIKSYTNAPPIDADLWFYIVRWAYDASGSRIVTLNVTILCIRDVNNPNTTMSQYSNDWTQTPSGENWEGWKSVANEVWECNQAFCWRTH